MSFAIFNEEFYLNSNPDVRAAVNARAVSSGFAHFQQFGLAEGRVNVSPYFDEGLYLRKYPDVAAVVRSGSLKSGLQHYIQSGEAEGRSPGSFNEQYYRQRYPDVAAAIQAGTFSSGLQHYIRYGQFESNRAAVFTGSTGNDTLTGFGALSTINGLYAGNEIIVGNDAYTRLSGDTGRGQVDTLIGNSGQNLFNLGGGRQIGTTSFYSPETYYTGGGNTDYALIKNFERGKDSIALAGGTLSGYRLQSVNGNLNISTSAGDLIGVVEGVTSLTQLPDNNLFDPIFFAG